MGAQKEAFTLQDNGTGVEHRGERLETWDPQKDFKILSRSSAEINC